jgi:gamma-glutamyltranspeptidase/glutathione hydrolase
MQKIRSVLYAAVIAIAPLAPAFAASPALVAAEHGMVVTAHRLASEVGADILKQGGNAIDAAVAVGYALAVVYPTAGNIGGGGFMTIHLADGRSAFIDFRERAPGAANETMYLDKQGNVIPGASTDTWLAVGVPGPVMGFEKARAEFGTMPMAKLMAPAIRYAEDGFAFTPADVAEFADANASLAKDRQAAAIFLKDGQPLNVGDRLVQTNLAKTLKAISAGGTDAFYKGAIADAIVGASSAGKGILQKSDFEAYAAKERKPVECDYRGYHVISSPPPSSGGAIICEILNILEAYPLGHMGFHSADGVHAMTEAMRYAFVDRNTKLGDPDFVQNPVGELTDKGYAAKLRAKIDPYRAGVSKDLIPAGFTGEKPQTTSYAVIDDAGNAVAVTYTLNGSFGTRMVAGDTGVLMNNEMDDFTSKPGVPNLYGLIQGEANAIRPGKTPLSSMSPTIVTKDGKTVMVIGSPGGARIITIVAEAIMNVVDYGMDLQEAIDAPRIHHQWLPDKITIEPYALSADTIRALSAMGHSVKEDPDWPIWGEAAGIIVGGPALGKPAPDGRSRYFGAIDSRATAGAAIGY